MALAAETRIPQLRRQLAALNDDVPNNQLLVRRRQLLLCELQTLIDSETDHPQSTEPEAA